MPLPTINAIPPQLCTSQEAAQILSLNRPLTKYQLRRKKYKNLHFTHVFYNHHKTILFNRKEVQAFAAAAAPHLPSDYISSKEAAALIYGTIPTSNQSKIAQSWMKRRQIPQITRTVNRIHSYWHAPSITAALQHSKPRKSSR